LKEARFGGNGRGGDVGGQRGMSRGQSPTQSDGTAGRSQSS